MLINGLLHTNCTKGLLYALLQLGCTCKAGKPRSFLESIHPHVMNWQRAFPFRSISDLFMLQNSDLQSLGDHESLFNQLLRGPRDYLDTSAFDIFSKSVPMRNFKKWY